MGRIGRHGPSDQREESTVSHYDYNDEILSHYGIEKQSRVNVPDARRTSYGDWSKKMGEALKECGSCMENLVKGAVTGASVYSGVGSPPETRACAKDFQKVYTDLLEAEIKLKAARRSFEKALKCRND